MSSARVPAPSLHVSFDAGTLSSGLEDVGVQYPRRTDHSYMLLCLVEDSDDIVVIGFFGQFPQLIDSFNLASSVVKRFADPEDAGKDDTYSLHTSRVEGLCCRSFPTSACNKRIACPRGRIKGGFTTLWHRL